MGARVETVNGGAITDPSDCNRIADAALGPPRGVDILVNLASPWATVRDISEEERDSARLAQAVAIDHD
jgi:hypothetical protein